ncbi:ferredoxin [Mycolicibacterium sphagni]|uniref:Ferredoxin n=1 Tax=Mycolicibacterium sphagni TaxID=1786 RepID=A0A255D9Z1_9MYCO|nr:ferredoxin [Mycolicibacterium sphagni]OYN76247.1 hypothetical protein CG716_22990 [Mycolicibacterium sphagni]
MELSILKRECCGHGRCFTYFPQLFEPDEEGLGRPRFETVPAGQAQLARLAVTECPERAIVLTTTQPDRSVSGEDQR